VTINAQRFVWDPAETVEEVIRFGLRTSTDYLGELKQRGALRKLIERRHRLWPALRFLFQHLKRKFVSRLPIELRATWSKTSMAAKVETCFRGLQDRGVQVAIVYSSTDVGLHELEKYFGTKGKQLKAYSNVGVAIISDADHNLTTAQAARRLCDHLVDYGRSLAANRPAAAE
jgi:hypothetical protein